MKLRAVLQPQRRRRVLLPLLLVLASLATLGCDRGAGPATREDGSPPGPAETASADADAEGTSPSPSGAPGPETSDRRASPAPPPDSRPPGATLAQGGAGSFSLTRGSIVYESHGANRVSIHRYDAGAARPVALTDRRARDLRPRWSPDGEQVAFFSAASGNDEIWVVNADGTGLRRLTDHPGADFDPDWMPDGRIVFASDRDGDDNIWVLDPRDGAVAQLTHYDSGRTGGPSVAADGRRLTFSSDGIFSWQVYVLELGTGAIERVTGPAPGACNPAWRPGSDRIAYMSGGDLIGTDLRSITPSGADSRRLAGDTGNNEDPQFSEDGSRMVWVSDRDGNWEIWEADGDGNGERRVSRTGEDERHPDLHIGSG
jgi:Tol biopolymer transport system component